MAANSGVVEVVIRILGYNLAPFDEPQQAVLQEALVAVLPSLTVPVRPPCRSGPARLRRLAAPSCQRV